jgi:pyrroline-5-carboxylate reductase
MRILFVGGGNMATALIGGMKAKGFDPAQVTVVEPFEAGREKIARDFGVTAVILVTGLAVFRRYSPTAAEHI